MPHHSLAGSAMHLGPGWREGLLLCAATPMAEDQRGTTKSGGRTPPISWRHRWHYLSVPSQNSCSEARGRVVVSPQGKGNGDKAQAQPRAHQPYHGHTCGPPLPRPLCWSSQGATPSPNCTFRRMKHAPPRGCTGRAAIRGNQPPCTIASPTRASSSSSFRTARGGESTWAHPRILEAKRILIY